MNSRRLLLPGFLASALLAAFFLFPQWHQLSSQPIEAGTAPTIRYVATTGVDANSECTDPSAPCRTVQRAVDVAKAGDEVHVASGVYTDTQERNGVTQTVYISKSIGIIGGYTTTTWALADAEPMPWHHPTVLDAQRRGRVVFISVTQNAFTPTTVFLEGLHLVGGDAYGLGGVTDSSYYNTTGVGGGLYARGGVIELHDTFVGFNRAREGGGLYFNRSSVHLTDSDVVSNSAIMMNGGGIYLFQSRNAVITHNRIEHNRAANAGGGLKSENSALRMKQNVIADNEAYLGGGVEVYSGTTTFKANVVYGNVVTEAGGGLQLSGVDEAILDNNLIFDNKAGFTGAGVDIYNTRAYLRHNTIVENRPNGSGDGSGVTVGGTLYKSGAILPTLPNVWMTNTLIVSNTVGVSVEVGAKVKATATLWWNARDIGGAGTVITSSLDVHRAPRFRNPARRDYHLRAFSPAVDAGVDTGLRSDGEGDRRPFGPAPDIGVDEVPYAVASPTDDWNFVYTDTEGISVTLDAPAGGVSETARIAFTRHETAQHEITGSFKFAGIAFDLEAYLDQADDLAEEDFTFDKPVTITLRYRDEDVAGIDEWSLKLYFWTGSYWKDIAADCGTAYTRDLANNILYVPICHLSAFGMHGVEDAGYDLFIPLVVK